MKLLILSDIHGNWPALEAVLHAEPEWDAVAFCGDVVDYGPNPVECLRWVTENAEHRVRGNHDNAVAFDVDCHCMGSFREFSVATRAWHQTLIRGADRHSLANLLTLDWFEWQGRHFRMAHATPQGDLFEYLPMDRWGERIEGLDSDFILIGHTHVQGMKRFGEVTVVNPGSVGLARDHNGEACYAIHDGTRMALRRVPYDVNRTIADLKSSSLTPRVISGLSAVLMPPARRGEDREQTSRPRL
jgi:putative phosphoesterase